MGPLVLAPLIALAAIKSALAAEDLKQLQGKWRIVHSNCFVFDEDLLRERFIEFGGPDKTGRIRLNPLTVPKQIDWLGAAKEEGGILKVKGRVGVYELRGDELKITFGGELSERADGSFWVLYGKRPTAIGNKEGDHQTSTWVLKRQIGAKGRE